MQTHTGVRLFIGSKFRCVFCSEICIPEGRGGEQGGSASKITMIRVSTKALISNQVASVYPTTHHITLPICYVSLFATVSFMQSSKRSAHQTFILDIKYSHQRYYNPRQNSRHGESIIPRPEVALSYYLSKSYIVTRCRQTLKSAYRVNCTGLKVFLGPKVLCALF